MKWRKWNNAIHRDLGYLCFGLTLVYAVSGLAVNHMLDWNPNYRVEQTVHDVGPLTDFAKDRRALVAEVLKRLEEKAAYKSSFQDSRDKIKIFVEGGEIEADIPSGRVLRQKAHARPLLYQMNALHLNHPKKLWTWFADLYAAGLSILAVTGLFVLKGKKGLKGRGKWLAAAGIAIPAIFAVWYL